MKNVPLLLATLVGTLILVFGVAFMFGRSGSVEVVEMARLMEGARHTVTLGETSTASPSADVVDATGEATPDATDEATEPQGLVSILEFSDFQCPACKAALPVKSSLEAQFPGQVTFTYRHFPLLSIHPNALLAAQAAEAAAEYDKFWQMHDKLFETQEDWAELSNDEAKERFIQFAVELGMEKELFTNTINSDTVKSAVQADINKATELRLSSTPTFFVNGEEVSASGVIPKVQELLQK